MILEERGISIDLICCFKQRALRSCEIFENGRRFRLPNAIYFTASHGRGSALSKQILAEPRA